jgi:hypothetical protein
MKNKDRGITVQVGQLERMHFVLGYKWRLMPMVVLMATSASGLIKWRLLTEFYPEKWRLLPNR